MSIVVQNNFVLRAANFPFTFLRFVKALPIHLALPYWPHWENAMDSIMRFFPGFRMYAAVRLPSV